MSDNDTNDKKRTATDHPVFGYDQRGRAHRYDAVRATVVVTADGEVVHEEQLAKPAVPAWIEFVAETCSWLDCWWHAETLPVDRYRSAKAQAADIRYERAKSEATA